MQPVFTVGLHSRYQEETVLTVYALSSDTLPLFRHWSAQVEHSPRCKGASASGASIRPDRNFPDSWRRPWRLCLRYLGATCQLQKDKMPSSSSSRLSPKSCYTMSSCRLVRCGAVRCGRETSAPPLLQNPLVTWFCLCTALFISRQCAKKKESPETHKLCPNDNRGNAITGNTFTTNPALSPQWLFAACEPERRG